MTAEQRRQALDFGKIRGTGMPIPSGHLTVGSRAHVLNLYYEAAVISPTYFWRNKNRIGGSWKAKTAPSSTWKGRTSPSTSWKGKATPQDGTTQEI